MYEHPYLAYRVTAFEQEQAAEMAERRRVLMENSDRLRPRRGLVARMLRAVSPRGSRADAAVTSKPAPTRIPAESCAAGADCQVVAA